VNGIQRQLLAAALAAAERGWRVFPLRPGDKRPAVRDWQKRATSDPARIRACWTSGPYNVGIACGPSRLVVVDLDVPREDSCSPSRATGEQARNGHDVLTALARELGEPFPSDTYTVTTPSGGTHLYFRSPAGEPLRNTAGRIGWLIDTRADGGYVVGAGSVVGGHPYRVARNSAVAELPAWLADAARPQPSPGRDADHKWVADIRHQSGYATAALRAEVERVLNAQPGSRNHTLNAAAYSLGQLVAAGVLPDEPTQAALARAAQAAGLGDREIHATIRSGLAAGTRRPRAVRAH
jgi:hypothetical protein